MASPGGEFGWRVRAGGQLAPAEADPGRSLMGLGHRENILDIAVEGRHKTDHGLQSGQAAVVLEGMMSRPHDTIAVTTAISDQAPRQMVKACGVADLLEGAGHEEGSYRTAPWEKASALHPST